MILDVFIVSVILSLVFKRNIYHVFSCRIRLLYLFPVPFLIQILPFPQRGIVMLASYLILLLVFLMNKHLKGFPWIAAGSALNGLAIALYGGKMPVFMPLAEKLNLELTIKHAFVEQLNPLTILGDWIPVVTPYGRNFLISPGDTLIYAGVLIFMLSKTCKSTTQQECN